MVKLALVFQFVDDDRDQNQIWMKFDISNSSVIHRLTPWELQAFDLLNLEPLDDYMKVSAPLFKMHLTFVFV